MSNNLRFSFSISQKFVLIITLTALVFTGCKNGSSGPQPQPQPQGETLIKPEINISGSKTVLASSQMLKSQTVANKVTNVKALTRTAGQPETGSNLLAIDAAGNSVIAFQAEGYAIKVMYTVMDPNGKYLYVALDPGVACSNQANISSVSSVFQNCEGGAEDYRTFISATSCAIFQVDITDNSYSCVMQDHFLQRIDENYKKTISMNLKPIQFGKNGELYFSAAQFERETVNGVDTIDPLTKWQPVIYKKSAAGDITQITQDNVLIDFFIALKSGEIMYQSTNIDKGAKSLYLYNNDGKTIPLSGCKSEDDCRTAWGVDFFATDSNNAVMFGEWSTGSIRFAKPRTLGGVERATIDTKLFNTTFESSSQSDGYMIPSANTECIANPTDKTSYPLRILVDEKTGSVYGAFRSWAKKILKSTTATGGVASGNNNSYCYYRVLSVYQILPANRKPKLEIKLADDSPDAWWKVIKDAPFQISGGYLYYVDKYDGKDFYGLRDVIAMVRLQDLKTTLVLADGRYEIYGWTLSGGILYFSAQDLNLTKVVTGEIDTVKVQNGAVQTDYLKRQETTSALDSTAKILDIQPLVTPVPEVQISDPPAIEKLYFFPENRSSLSFGFNKLMNRDSIDSAFSLKDSNANLISTLKIWIGKRLHIIPDLDANPNGGLSDAIGSTPLALGSTYTIDISSTATDEAGTVLAIAYNKAIQTEPGNGFYVTLTDANDALISAENMAKYTGCKQTQVWVDPWSGMEFKECTTPDEFVVAVPHWSIQGSDGYGNFEKDYLAFDPVSAKSYKCRIAYPAGTDDVYNANGHDINWIQQSADLKGLPLNFRLEFSAKNTEYSGLRISLSSGEFFLNMDSNYAYMQYTDKFEQTQYRYSSWNPAPPIFNGSWMKYRLDIYKDNYGDNQIRVSYSIDGSTFTAITFEVWDWTTGDVSSKTSFSDFKGVSATSALKFTFRAATALDNIQISTLKNNGDLKTPPAGDSVNLPLNESDTLPGFLAADYRSDGSYWDNLKGYNTSFVIPPQASFTVPMDYWMEDYLNSGVDIWYSFDALNGTTYQIAWQDAYNYDTTSGYIFNGDLAVSVYHEDKTTLYKNIDAGGLYDFLNVDSGFSYINGILATADERVYIKISGYYWQWGDLASGNGNFWIKVY